MWYGRKKREYRLTRFGAGFPFLGPDSVGDLFVLVARDRRTFSAYVLSLDEDIADLLAALGVESFERWGVYRDGAAIVETENTCLEREYLDFARPLSDFPTGDVFSARALEMLAHCVRGFAELTPDAALLRAIETEYGLFRVAERQICTREIERTFDGVDDFLQTAARLMNRRKARAGRSLENHVEHLLKAAGIPHEMRPPGVDGSPDVVIPNAAAYRDPHYPVDRLVILGVKTTCKDRWRQVLNEGRRVPAKYIFTVQQGISAAQLAEMHDARVTLVVPERLHADYPRTRAIEMLTVGAFLDRARQLAGVVPATVEQRLF